MIKSLYIRQIMEALVKNSEFEVQLLNQLPYLEEKEYEFTGAGLIVTFEKDPLIISHRLNQDIIIGGVEIHSPDLELGAEANLVFQDGVVLYLEIFSNSGYYPAKELQNYQISKL